MSLYRTDEAGRFTVTDIDAKLCVSEADTGEQIGEQIVVTLDGAELRLCTNGGPNYGAVGDVKVRCYRTELSRYLRGILTTQSCVVVNLESPRGGAYVVIPRCGPFEAQENRAPWYTPSGNALSLAHVARWEAQPLTAIVQERTIRLSKFVPGGYVFESLGFALVLWTRMMKARWVGWFTRWATAGLLWGLIAMMVPMGFSLLVVTGTALLLFMVPFVMLCYPLYWFREQWEARGVRRRYHRPRIDKE